MLQSPSPNTTYDAIMALGIAASQANDSAAAISAFQEASAVQPAAALPQFMLGAEFAALGDVAQAESAFASAVRLAPDFALARYQLGLLQFSSGRAAVALLTWQPLLTLEQPDDPLPHFAKGFEALARDKFDDALAHFERGLPLNTTNAALPGDIRKVIERINAIKSSHPLPATPEAQAADQAPEAPAEADAHFLLANYQQKGLAH
ncbi:tetratricopeptide repeat protein [Pseudacidovorax intermedius]|uniref:tetratricopeptide repeat protein n=1 Tax=Pseudacidovorax intermedius TaxID=433924 RepID=UPI00069DDA3C|nr:tetratricopeptide repeat protein [Pseudacidovorax intermedius]